MKDVKKERQFPLNLKFFGYEGDGGGTEGEGGGTAGNEGQEPGGSGNGDGGTGKQEKPKSFDEILAEGEYQAEFDRRIQKALEKQKSKLEVLFDEKATEAEKLAKMTKEEKAQYMAQKHEKELAEREAAITRRELMAEAKIMLADKKLPSSLSEVLNYTDADSCKQSIDALEKAFREAVALEVEEKLKGGAALTKAPQGTAVTKEMFSKMGYAERLKLKTEQPELYRQLSGN